MELISQLNLITTYLDLWLKKRNMQLYGISEIFQANAKHLIQIFCKKERLK